MAELATGTSPLRVRLERDGALLRLTLDRPKANLIDAGMIAALASALAAHRGTKGLRGVLLDHEGPPAGQPAIEGVCRVHYRAPTEGGSSGSPVFNALMWEVIALHHMGGKLGMPRLNGQVGTYSANEGISLGSIVTAMAR